MAVTASTLSEQVLTARLADVLEDRFDPGEFRLSETGACPRLRVLRVLGYEPEPPTEEEARYFERGHIAEAWVVQQYRRRYPRRTRRQVTVRPPLGIPAAGHIDLWIPPEKLIVEIKSVSRGSFDRDIPREEHILQVQAYLHFFRDSQGNHRTDDAELVYVCMDTLRTRTFPVKRDLAVGGYIASELTKLAYQALAHQLPPVGGFPDEPPCSIHMPSGPRRCPMWQHCHDDDGLGLSFRIQTAAGFETAAEEYVRLKEAVEEAKREFEQRVKPLEDRLEEIRRDIEAGLDGLGADDAQAGDYFITRTRVPGRISYDVEAATKAGVIPLEVRAALMAYAKQGKPYSRLTIKRGGLSNGSKGRNSGN